MKKAKRLLAVLLAAVMLMSAAYLPSYAYIIESDNYHNPGRNNIEQYYYTYDQGAAWVLDMLENLLGELNLIISCTDLNDMIKESVNLNLFTGNIWLNLDDPLENVGMVDQDGEGAIRLDTVDNTVKSLYALSVWIEDPGTLGSAAEGLGLLGDLLESNGLGCLIGNVNLGMTRDKVKDAQVLEHLISVIACLTPMLKGILGGTLDAGSLLEGVLNDLLADFLSSRTTLKTVGLGVKDLLYRLLINSEADIFGDGFDDPDTEAVESISTVDEALQQLVDWLLIDGTGEQQYDGGYSMAGMNADPLMPAIGDQPGAASLTGIEIQADQDLDGSLENHTMSFYQLVNNVIQGLLSSMLAPMLEEVLIDALDIEITEEYPLGDPAILGDTMYNTIVGAVTGLCEQNGAPELVFSNYLNSDTPVGQIRALLSWFLDKRDDGKKNGLSTFIEINFKGFHIQDNFMSLLNDVARLGVNLLPGLGLFEDAKDLAYTTDELNDYYAYDADKNIVSKDSESKVDGLYLTYETGEIVYVSEYITNSDGSKTPDIYRYFDDDAIVNTTNESGANYIDPSMIRQYYVVSTKQVYACLIKMLLDDLIDGCYFPEWADDIPTVLAYGLAALASPLLPENNYFARLDAYHSQQTQTGDIYDTNGTIITPIPYTVEKEIDIKNMSGVVVSTKTVAVPQAALDIGASYLAAFLNGILDRDESLETDTSFEKFACEFLIWGFTKYLPAFTGETNSNTGYLQNLTSTGEEGVFQAETNALIERIYANPATGEWKSTDKNDPSYDGIYDLIDQTILKLLPASWLPEINGSQQLILDWLVGNLCDFNLQGILGLLSVNTDPNAELHQPVLTILVRIIDRVLALIFNDSGVLIPNGRRGVVENGNVTNLTSLDALLDCNGEDASLPSLVGNLLTFINKYKVPILATILPLIASSEYERPYDEAYLGQNGIAYYKLADLKKYTDSFTQNINATYLIEFANEDDARAAVAGDATTARQDDGTFNIVLNNGTVYRNYPDNDSALIDLEYLKDAYYVPVESETEVDENDNPVITGYKVYYRESYLNTAGNAVTMIDTEVEYGQEYTQYQDFAYATITPRSRTGDFVEYGYEYQTFENEDFADRSYLRPNADSALEAAIAYQSEYKSFAENDLPAAYGEWYMFSIRSQMKANDLYDANDDGVSVLSTTDSNYVAPTTDANGNQTSPGAPVDGNPSYPEDTMYPFYTTSTGIFPFYDKVTGTTISNESMNLFNATNYEQIAMAVEYGSNPKNNIALSLRDTEDIVRFALNTVYFDITPNADGGFHPGHANWDTLTSSQWETLNTWVANNGFVMESITNEDGSTDYVLKRPAFKLLDSSLPISFSGVSSTPLLATDSNFIAIRNIRTMQDKTYEQELTLAIHNCYADYLENVYRNRRSLYNIMDNLSWRLEEAESNRSKPMENAGDLVILDWALKHASSAYKGDAGRNYKNTGKFVEGKPEVQKVYTSKSYAKFQQAYDYAQSLRTKVVSNAAATNEVTQSMITMAYQGILKTMRQLVPFTGFADWTQLNSYIDIAEEILSNPNIDDPVLGIASGKEALIDMLNISKELKTDITIDCESQDRVDQQAALLKTAIDMIKYNTEPTLIPNEDIASTVDTIGVTLINNRLVGHIFGLEEGKGITEEIYAENGALIVGGITINQGQGSYVSVTPSGRGNGTGSYIIGSVDNRERFRYFAVIYGDLNGDSRIDGSDASYIQYYIANGTNNEDAMGHVMFVAADANHDNVVDASDIIVIQNHATFKENSTISQTEHRVENVETATVAA